MSANRDVMSANPDVMSGICYLYFEIECILSLGFFFLLGSLYKSEGGGGAVYFRERSELILGTIAAVHDIEWDVMPAGCHVRKFEACLEVFPETNLD